MTTKGSNKTQRTAARDRTKVIPFNPLDKKVLGAAIAEAMLSTPARPLGTLEKFSGAGIYAIYYTGEFDAYVALAERNRGGKFEAPIYVGQALPEGGRKGIEVAVETDALYKRLSKHRKSIKAVENLSIDDFYCRVLVLDDTFIRLGEASLIAIYTPVWNSMVDGFGNNPPGSRRDGSVRSRWDTLHPGRPQAARHSDREETVRQIKREIVEELKAATSTGSRPFVVAEGQTTEAGAKLPDPETSVNVDAARTGPVDSASVGD